MSVLVRSARSLVVMAVVVVAALVPVGLMVGGGSPAGASAPVPGETWTARATAEANSWNSVAYGNGLFVAVASTGTNRVMTSSDGVTWTARTSAAAAENWWMSVTYGNGVFVAVANGGTNQVMTSTDGITWTARAAAEANGWRSVTYGNGLFVAVANIGTNRVMTSPDGVTWTARAAAEANSWVSVTYGNGVFVAVAFSGTNRVMTSPDGINWTARAAAEANSWFSVTYGNGVFVAVAVAGTNRVMTSTDGVTWTARAATEANQWIMVTYGNGLFVAVASTGTNRVMTSGALTTTPGALTTPDAPTSLAATPGDGSVSISFTAGADGGAAISKYQYSLDGGTSWLDATGTSSPITVGGLTNYTGYSVLVRAVNSAGAGAASSSVSAMPAYAAPVQSAPTVGSARRQILASWALLAPNQIHDRIKLYRATVYLAGTNTKVRSCKGGPTETSCVMMNLALETAYEVRVFAQQVIGTGPSKVVRRSLVSAPQAITLH